MGGKVKLKDQIIERPKKPDYVIGAPEAILVDVDGTLAINNGHRTWY